MVSLQIRRKREREKVFIPEIQTRNSTQGLSDFSSDTCEMEKATVIVISGYQTPPAYAIEQQI